MLTISPHESNAQTAVPVAWAVRLVERMQGLYGAKFAQQWESIAPARLAEIWAEELTGLTGEEIAAGLAACRVRPWPPTLPEFISLCRPSLNPEAAYHEAVAGMTARAQGKRGEWSHPAVYWAAVRISSHDLLSIGWQAIRGRWEAALRDVMSKGRWNDVPDPVQALPAPGSSHTSKEEATRFLRQIREYTGVSGPVAGNRPKDTKAWARGILENPAGKTLAVLQMAKRALELPQET